MARDKVIKDKFRARKGLYVDGDSILAGDVTIEGALTLQGEVDFGSELNIASISPHETITNVPKIHNSKEYLVTGPISVDSSMEINGDYLTLPRGDTNTRIDADLPWVEDGSVRYNTTTGMMEVVTNNQWKQSVCWIC